MRLSFTHFSLFAPILLVASFPAAAVANDTQKKGQSFPVTIGQPAPDGAHRDGPLFRKISEGMSDLRSVLAADVVMMLSEDARLKGPDQVMSAIGKIESDCDGPLSLDEGLQETRVGDSWVQVAWVCDTSSDVSVREFLKFEHSPEISVAFSFKEEKISLISVLEQFPMPPLWRVLPMDAYQRVKGDPNG